MNEQQDKSVITIQAQLDCMNRLYHQRRKYNALRIDRRKLHPVTSHIELAQMRAILETLQRVAAQSQAQLPCPSSAPTTP